VNNLEQNTTYRVHICEYTLVSDKEKYVTTSTTDNPVNFTTLKPITIDSVRQDSVVCYGESTGKLRVYISGGIAPYTCFWTGPITDNSIVTDLQPFFIEGVKLGKLLY